MHRSATLIALRFIAYIGHLFATLLFTLSRRDNVVVALKFDYTEDDVVWREREVGAACALILVCLGVEAIALFGGFSLFSARLTLLHLTCHTVGGGLTAVLVLTKAHYDYAWYLFGVFTLLPALCDTGSMLSACLRPGKRY